MVLRPLKYLEVRQGCKLKKVGGRSSDEVHRQTKVGRDLEADVLRA